LRNIPYQSKSDIEVAYKGQKLSTVYRPDLLVFDEIVVELKAAKTLASEHEAQLFKYMRISKKQVGYLINFGASKELERKRVAL